MRLLSINLEPREQTPLTCLPSMQHIVQLRSRKTLYITPEPSHQGAVHLVSPGTPMATSQELFSLKLNKKCKHSKPGSVPQPGNLPTALLQ